MRVDSAARRYQDIFLHTVEGIFRTTPEGTFLDVNPSFARMLGYDSPEHLRAAVTDIARDLHVDPSDRDEFLARLATDGVVKNHEARYRRRDGSVIWVSITAHATRAPAGSILYIDGFVQDISERRRLLEQLVQSQKMEAVGRLAGGIAHDFNNLLTVIAGYCEMLADRLGDSSRARAEIQEVRDAVALAADLTRQLLAFSRQQVLQLRKVDVNSVLRNIHPMLRRLIGETVELVLSLADGRATVRADPTQLEQVIMNLVVNARDAMPAGGRLTLVTRCRQAGAAADTEPLDVLPGPAVVMEVIDTGDGMTEEVLRHLFEPFFTTKPPGRGTGLGLSTVYGIVRQSGGTISASSSPGRGSRFTVALPMADDDSDGWEPAGRPPGGPGTALLAEDDTMESENGSRAFGMFRECSREIDIAGYRRRRNIRC